MIFENRSVQVVHVDRRKTSNDEIGQKAINSDIVLEIDKTGFILHI